MTTEWDTIMKPLADSTVWANLRRAAADSIVRDLGPDSGFGISSSDQNHVIFGAAKAVARTWDRDADSFPFAVLAYLEES